MDSKSWEKIDFEGELSARVWGKSRLSLPLLMPIGRASGRVQKKEK